MVMFSAMAVGIGFPLNVMQLLWINIISDIFPGLALSMGEPDPDVLKEPPRDPDAPLFDNNDYKEMAYESGIISAATMGAYGVGIGVYGMGAKSHFPGVSEPDLWTIASRRQLSIGIPGDFQQEQAPLQSLSQCGHRRVPGTSGDDHGGSGFETASGRNAAEPF